MSPVPGKELIDGGENGVCRERAVQCSAPSCSRPADEAVPGKNMDGP